jgi:hypothetical protein
LHSSHFWSRGRCFSRSDGSLAADVDRWDDHWTHRSQFRCAYRVMTTIGGIGLITEAAVRATIVYRLPLSTAAATLVAITATTIVARITWTHWYTARVIPITLTECPE